MTREWVNIDIIINRASFEYCWGAGQVPCWTWLIMSWLDGLSSSQTICERSRLYPTEASIGRHANALLRSHITLMHFEQAFDEKATLMWPSGRVVAVQTQGSSLPTWQNTWAIETEPGNNHSLRSTCHHDLQPGVKSSSLLFESWGLPLSSQ